MKNDNRSPYLTRDSILKLLSDDEVAKVTTAETAARLTDGDEFIDLEKFNLGVQQASSHETAQTPMGRVLPKKAVHADTWKKIVAQLPAGHPATAGTV
jgi:hypothetical protein